MFKKVILVAAALFGLTAGFIHAQENGGNTLTAPYRDTQLKKVYNQDAVSHAVGTVVIYVSTTVGTYPGVSVSTTVTPYDQACAGVVVERAIAANDWGFIATRGYVDTVLYASATTFGNLFWPSDTAGRAASNVVVGSSEAVAGCGRAMGTLTGSGSTAGYILR